MKKIGLFLFLVGLSRVSYAAVNHYAVDDSKTYGRLVKSTLAQQENGLNQLNQILGTMAQMLSGDGTQDAHYTYITNKFGFPDDATSHAAYNELNSLAAKLNTDASVTNVNAALKQAFNRFR